MEQSAPAVQESALHQNEVLRLKCPACGGGLNLKRQHLGIAGICVHCNEAIRAEENGSSGEVFIFSLQKNIPHEESPPLVPEPVEWQGEVSAGDDFPVIDLADPPSQAQHSVPEEQTSPWGFPSPKAGDSQEEIDAFSGTMNAATAKMPKKEGDPERNDTKSDQEKKSALPPPDGFGQEGGLTDQQHHASRAEEVAFPFGDKTEGEGVTFDPASPWANREVGGDDEEEEVSPGFAETLFPTGAGSVTPDMPQSKGKGQVQPHLSSPLVDKPELSSAAIGLAIEKHKRAGKAGPVTRFMRFIIVLTLLFGFGYVAVLFAPPAMIDSAKAKISEWSKSGDVLKDYLPVERPAAAEKTDPDNVQAAPTSEPTKKEAPDSGQVQSRSSQAGEAEKKQLPPE